MADDHEPAVRVVGHPVDGPLRRGREQRLLERVLRVREVARAPDQHGEDLRRERAQQVLVDGRVTPVTSGASITARTSMTCWIGTPPTPGEADAFAAISIARSSLSTSTIQKPARNSFDSANGPSVMTGGCTPSLRTSLAWSGHASPSAPTSSPLATSDASRSCWNWIIRRRSSGDQVSTGGTPSTW